MSFAAPLSARVSAVVPSHNHRRFLPKRLLSISAQSHPVDELIIIDDGSTDGSADWLRAWRGAIPARLEYRPVAGGNPFATWNAGTALASGDWLWIAESDDTCRPEFLERLLAAAARQPDAAIVFCQSETTDTRGRVIGGFADYTRPNDTETWATDFAMPGPEAVARLLLFRNTIPNVSACLISRRAWLAADGAETSLNLCGDWLTYGRLLQHGSLVFCAASLNRHRQHASSQRARTSRSEYVRQGYEARRQIADIHAVLAQKREFPRRYAWSEAVACLGTTPEELPQALSDAALDAARAFDPQFDARATRPDLGSWDYCDLFVHETGAFSESNKRRQPIRTYDSWETLVFRACAGRVRLDPFARPGRCWLRRLELRSGGGNEVLWAANPGNGFTGLDPGHQVTLTRQADALEISCPHNDAQLMLPPMAIDPNLQFDLVAEMRYALE